LQGIEVDGEHESKQILVAAEAQAERMRKQEVFAAPFTLSWGRQQSEHRKSHLLSDDLLSLPGFF
jgi:hypothetical protein